MKKYRICVFMPKGYQHTRCFVEVVSLLKCSFDSLRIPCDTAVNQLAQDRTNILVGINLARFDKTMAQYRYIPYQLEQLGAHNGWFSENMAKILEYADEVWDYSTENIEFLAENGITAKHLPVGYHEKLEGIRYRANKDIDVLFYGSINERRQNLLNRIIADRNIAVKVLFGTYGQERDAYIARSEIILNIHHFSTKIFEAVRISYLLNNRCFVLTEESAVNPYPGVDLAACAYDDLAERCRYSLAHSEERERIRDLAHDQFKENYPMTSLLEKVLR